MRFIKNISSKPFKLLNRSRMMDNLIRQRVKEHGHKICIECKSPDLDNFNQVYVKGEFFCFSYCKNCGLVQWHVVPGFHLSLEKLYELYLQLADEFGLSQEETLSGLEFIKLRKGDEGYSDDAEILREIFMHARMVC